MGDQTVWMHWLIFVCFFFSSDESQEVHITLNILVLCKPMFRLFLYRESYMSAHVLLNLLNELGKRDKMRGLLSILSLFRNEFNKFNNTRARMLDSIYHITLRLFWNLISVVKTLWFCHYVHNVVMKVIMFPKNLWTTSDLSILFHGAISLPDARQMIMNVLVLYKPKFRLFKLFHRSKLFFQKCE